MMNYILNEITYDRDFDVLYVSFKKTSNSYGDEDIDHVVIFKDYDTEEITGLTIFDFKSLFERKDKAMNIVSEFLNPQDMYNRFISL